MHRRFYIKPPQSAQRFSRLAALLLLCAAACQAQDVSQHFIETLDKARQTWREGDELGAQLHTVVMSTTNDLPRDFNALVDRQKAAYDNAAKLFEQALEIDPKNPQALSEFGRYWAARKDMGLARHFYESAWTSEYPPKPGKDTPSPEPEKNEPRSPFNPEKCGSRAERELTTAEKADVLRGLGGVAERAGEISVALTLYRVALERYPDDPRNRVSLAIALCAAGTPAAALEVLQPPADGEKPAPTLDSLYSKHPPVYALACYTLGYIHEQLGYYDQALSQYQRAQELSQSSRAADTDVTENARMAIVRLGDRLEDLATEEKEWDSQAAARARADAVKIVRSFGQAPSKLNPSARCLKKRARKSKRRSGSRSRRSPIPNLPICSNRFAPTKFPPRNSRKSELRRTAGRRATLFHTAEMKLWTRAVAEILARMPAPEFLELAALKLQLRRYTPARQYLDAAEIFSPNDIAVLGLRGGVLLEMGQWEDAAIAFRKILMLDSENGAAHFGLGRALAALRTNEVVCSNALDAFARAVKLGVRDERLYRSSTLILKDGQKLSGWIKHVGDDYVLIKEGEAPVKIDGKDVDTLEYGPGLRQVIAETLVRYQHGERPPPPERIVGQKHRTPDDLQNPGRGESIFGPMLNRLNRLHPPHQPCFRSPCRTPSSTPSAARFRGLSWPSGSSGCAFSHPWRFLKSASQKRSC